MKSYIEYYTESEAKLYDFEKEMIKKEMKKFLLKTLIVSLVVGILRILSEKLSE